MSAEDKKEPVRSPPHSPPRSPARSIVGEFLRGAANLGADLLSTAAVEAAAGAMPMSAADKKRLRRAARQGVNRTAKAVGAAAKRAVESARKGKEKPPSLGQIQLNTACGALGMRPPPFGKQVDLEKAREAKLAAARLYHPDKVGNESKRAQFEVVVRAYEWLEKYNESLLKK